MAEEHQFSIVNLRHPQGQTPRSSAFDTRHSDNSIHQQPQPPYDPYHTSDSEIDLDTKYEPTTYPPTGPVQVKLGNSVQHSPGRDLGWNVLAGKQLSFVFWCLLKVNSIFKVLRNLNTNTRGSTCGTPANHISSSPKVMSQRIRYMHILQRLSPLYSQLHLENWCSSRGFITICWMYPSWHGGSSSLFPYLLSYGYQVCWVYRFN